MNAENLILRLKESRADCNYGKGKHIKAANRKNSCNHWLGIPSILLSLAISTTFFLDIKTDYPEFARWLGTISGLIIASFSGIQTYFSFPKIVEGHRRSACKFRNLAKQCSNTIAAFGDGVIDDKNLYQKLNEITNEYSEIATDAETYPTNNNDYLKTKVEINSGNEQYTQKELETKE